MTLRTPRRLAPVWLVLGLLGAGLVAARPGAAGDDAAQPDAQMLLEQVRRTRMEKYRYLRPKYGSRYQQLFVGRIRAEVLYREDRGLMSLAVDRNGIGRVLVEAFADRVRASGARDLWLITDAVDNEKTRKFTNRWDSRRCVH